MISANSAFCRTCGNRINLPNASVTVENCPLHRTAAQRAAHFEEQRKLEEERSAQLKPKS